MALINDLVKIESGGDGSIVHKGCYVVIDTLMGSELMTASYRYYRDSTKQEPLTRPRHIQVNVDKGLNVFEQVYAVMKLTDEFKNSIDC